MKDFQGKVAVVTGAASGIGRSISHALVAAGAKVALVDVDSNALDRTRQEFDALCGEVAAYVADVSDHDALARTAESIRRDFGKLHLAFNNAGVEFSGTAMADMSSSDWSWLMGVNFAGVLNGVRNFLPMLQAHGEEAWIINTASVSGFFPLPPALGMGAYSTSKFAVVALTEALDAELAGTPVGATLLVPGLVNTRIATSGRNRLPEFGGPSDHVLPALEEAVKGGMRPDEVGRLVLQGILDEQFYVFTHDDTQARIADRQRRIARAFEWRAAALGKLDLHAQVAH